MAAEGGITATWTSGPRFDVKSTVVRLRDEYGYTGGETVVKDAVAGYQQTAPHLASWLEDNVPEALTVLAFPAAHRRRLRTSNALERLNKEIKRRTRVATLFPNEASLLRLASAVLAEISDDWETERAYLNMEAKMTHL
jgi:transposase-like protein